MSAKNDGKWNTSIEKWYSSGNLGCLCEQNVQYVCLIGSWDEQKTGRVGAINDQTVIKYSRLKSFLLYNVFTLGNLISNLTKLSFLLHWREQAWPLTCSVIKAKQTPSISCHYRAGAGRREGKGEREKKMVEGRKERRVKCITRKGCNKGWREWRRKDGSEGAKRRGFGEGARKRKQSGQIRFRVEGSEQSDYSN